MKKVLVIADTGAVSFYRAHGALLEHQDLVEVRHPRHPGELDWVDIKAADIVWMSRALTPEHIDICKQVKDIGRTLILDYDDAIFSVPASNPNWEDHLKFPESTRKCVALADTVVFSTPGVRSDFERHGAVPALSHVIRNRSGWPARWAHNDASKIVAWRGSPTHGRDIDKHQEAIVAYCKNIGAEEFYFYGCLHDQLCIRLNAAGIKVQFSPSQPIHTYIVSLRALAPHSMVVPLLDCDFNDAKSDIAATEALAAGAMPVVFGRPQEFSWIDPTLSYESLRDLADLRDQGARGDFRGFLSDL